MIINTHPQCVYNKKDTFIVHIAAAKAKIQKACNLMHLLDGNGCKVSKCTIFMGGDHGVKDAEKVEKNLKQCAPTAKREFGKETEIKTKGGIELLACISAVQGCGHLVVEGNTVKVCHDGKCAVPG